MKKLSIIACGILLISLSSCSTKCTCTTAATGTYASMYTPTTSTIDVKGSCSDANTSTTSAGTTYTSTCK